MAYRNSRWNSRVKKVFYLFFVGVLSIPRNAFFVTREAFVVLEFAFATPVCYVTNFLLFTVIHKSNESQCTQLITSLRSVRIVVFNEPQRARPSAITTYANIRRWYHFFQFFVWFISFILERKRSIALSFGQISSPKKLFLGWASKFSRISASRSLEIQVFIPEWLVTLFPSS